MDSSCPLIQRLAKVLDRQPEAIAVASSAGVVTYRELWASAVSWRDRLRSSGLSEHSVVALLSSGSPELVPAFLGVRAANLVPLLVDTLIPPGRRDEMIRIARAAAVVDPASGSDTDISVICEDPLVLPAAAGYVTFSSGSQGPPKGILGNAEGVARFLDWERELLGLGASSRVGLLTSPSFDVALRDMLLPLLSGGVLCVPGVRVRTDPAAVIPWLEENDVNVVHLVPSLGVRWVAAAESARLDGLRWTLFAGEPLYERHVDRWRAIAPATRVVNLYGPSETTLAKFWHVVETPARAGLVPVGRALPGTRLHSDTSAPAVSADGSFRISIETPDGSLGYLPDGREGTDAGALTRRDGVTRFTTQDRGRLDTDGVLYVEGRLDGLVKRNGVMIDLADVTSHALRDPEVAQACCVQVDPDASGEVVLAIECTAAFSLRRLTDGLRRVLGPAMPNAVELFDPLPMLSNGKIDRRRVRAEIEERRGGQAS